MNIQPIQRPRVRDQVIEAILTMIARNKLQAGDKLPSEGELANELQVGSRSVRDAFGTLEARGIVEVKHGKGVFLVTNRIDHFLESLSDALKYDVSRDPMILLDLTDFRQVMEISAVRRVSGTNEKAHIDDLKRIIDRMRIAADAGQMDEYNSLDHQFHMHIVEMSGNRIMVTIYQHLKNLLLKSMARTGYIQRDLQASCAEHEQIFELIRDGKPDEARIVMIRHLSHSEQTLKDALSNLEGE